MYVLIKLRLTFYSLTALHFYLLSPLNCYEGNNIGLLKTDIVEAFPNALSVN